MAIFDKGFGLVIAIANYSYVRKLPEAILNDGKDVYDLLCSSSYCGYSSDNTHLLLDDLATLDAIRTNMRRLAESTNKNSTVIIYFSGHGWRNVSSDPNRYYLLPYDCDPYQIDKTALSGEEFTDLLQNIQAQRLLVIFDCCYSGGTSDAKDILFQQPLIKNGLDLNYYEQLAKGTGRVIISSSRSGEVSFVLSGMKNSLFTHCLLEALHGKADTHGDGLIRVFDIFDYVSRTVPNYAAQHPIFKANNLENNFPITLYLGGKGINGSAGNGNKTTVVDKTKLRTTIIGSFNLEEIADVCADIEQSLTNRGIKLQVNIDVLSGTTKQAKVRELIEYLDRRGYLSYLVETVRIHRPHVIFE